MRATHEPVLSCNDQQIAGEMLEPTCICLLHRMQIGMREPVACEMAWCGLGQVMPRSGFAWWVGYWNCFRARRPSLGLICYWSDELPWTQHGPGWQWGQSNRLGPNLGCLRGIGLDPNRSRPDWARPRSLDQPFFLLTKKLSNRSHNYFVIMLEEHRILYIGRILTALETNDHVFHDFIIVLCTLVANNFML